MKDILKKYKRHTLISNLGVVAASLVLAFGINVFLIDGTQIGQNLKANVLQSNEAEGKADVFIEKIGDNFALKNSKKINNVTNISFGLVYNAENITLSDISSQYGNIIELQNESGINSIIVNFDSVEDIELNKNIIEFSATKKDDIKIENINILNANFKDETGELYTLSTSGTAF